ncbi:carbohydrate binding domain containing protein [Holotrichia oblita]|uniref:Carbohydrate binding domain containing protein n=1 Tax=Holotrichia oblita TaxID=644536 RepID=A0ACB9T5Y2_HOLOL|nr:carbohydrate binding domain containing protein [Holotrichia oblita]
MLGGKKHYTAQSTQPEISDKLNRYTFLEKSSAQLDEHFKRSKLLHELQIPVERNGIFSLRFSNDNSKLITSYGNGIIDVRLIKESFPIQKLIVSICRFSIWKLNETRKELEQSNNEARALRETIKAMNQKWEKKLGEMESNFKNLERRIENMEKEKRKNNIVVTETEIDEKQEEVVKQMEEWMKYCTGSRKKVKGSGQWRILMPNWEYSELKTKFHKTDRGPEDVSVTNFHALRIFCAKFHPTEEHIFLTGGWDDVIKIWDVRIKEGCVRNIVGPRICGEAIDVKEKRVLTGSWTVNNSLQIWDMASGKLVENINPINRVHTLDGEFLYCCQYFKDEKREYVLVASSGTSSFEIINIKELKIISSYKAQKTIQAIDSNISSIVTYGGMDPYINVVLVV